MMFGKKSKRELLLKARIKELENLLCPGEQHDYHQVDEVSHVIDGRGTTTYTRRFVCKRCLKAVEKHEFI